MIMSQKYLCLSLNFSHLKTKHISEIAMKILIVIVLGLSNYQAHAQSFQSRTKTSTSCTPKHSLQIPMQPVSIWMDSPTENIRSKSWPENKKPAGGSASVPFYRKAGL